LCTTHVASCRYDLVRISCVQTITGAVDWGRHQVTKRDHHGEARTLLESTFRALAIIKWFAVLSALHPAADMNAVSRHVCPVPIADMNSPVVTSCLSATY
jgi:hypothetical protein